MMTACKAAYHRGYCDLIAFLFSAELLSARVEDLELDKVYAARDLEILEDIQKLQDETKGRELKYFQTLCTF